MRIALAACVLAAAACGGSPGVYLVLEAPAGVTDVAVYLGKEPCIDRAGAPCSVAPPGLGRLDASGGGAWYRDATSAFTATAGGGVARVHIEASAPNETLQLVVLGLDQAGTPIATTTIRDLAVPTSRQVNVSATLRAAQLVTSADEAAAPHGDGDYVLSWTSAAAPSDCVVTETWKNGAVTRTFVVPVEDGDCDGFPTLDGAGKPNPLECDAYWFDFAQKQVSTSRADCATLDLVEGLHACLLGGTGCVDGKGPDSTCVRADPTTCVPAAVCGSGCATPGSTAPLSSCTAAGPPITEIHCIVYADDLGQPCTGIASPKTGKMVLDALFAGTSTRCKQVAFSPTDSLANPDLQNDKLFPPQPSTAELDLALTTAGPCNLDVTWVDGGVVAPASSPQRAVADITATNDNHVFVPVTLEYQSCTTPTNQGLGVVCTLTIAANDTITSCTR